MRNCTYVVLSFYDFTTFSALFKCKNHPLHPIRNWTDARRAQAFRRG